VLAILGGAHALYKVGTRMAERGLIAVLPPGLERESRNDDRLGQLLDAQLAATLNQVWSTLTRKALEVYALPTPWLHHDTATRTRYGASESRPEPRDPRAPEAEGLVGPRPASGHSQDGRDDRTHVLRSVGVRSDGGLPRRLGSHDGHPRGSTGSPWPSRHGWHGAARVVSASWPRARRIAHAPEDSGSRRGVAE
jgi:hypothetical protein